VTFNPSLFDIVYSLVTLNDLCYSDAVTSAMSCHPEIPLDESTLRFGWGFSPDINRSLIEMVKLVVVNGRESELLEEVDATHRDEQLVLGHFHYRIALLRGFLGYESFEKCRCLYCSRELRPREDCLNNGC
jgi:hypothetical protein